jgi:hypothetical protein
MVSSPLVALFNQIASSLSRWREKTCAVDPVTSEIRVHTKGRQRVASCTCFPCLGFHSTWPPPRWGDRPRHLVSSRQNTRSGRHLRSNQKSRSCRSRSRSQDFGSIEVHRRTIRDMATMGVKELKRYQEASLFGRGVAMVNSPHIVDD